MTELGKYEIIAEIGRGRFAIVYKAWDTELGQVVALKVLHSNWAADPDFATRFREARAVERLRHHNIAAVYEIGETEGQLYIATEYLPGRTLRALLEAEGALPLERAAPILKQIAEALDRAHAQGVIHCDVRPGNVIVEETGRTIRATLIDFGLVKAIEGSIAFTSQETQPGSPEYMAPEQANPERAAEVGPATDRYALGVVAYQMLTGRVPFPGDTPATLDAHEHEPIPPPRSLRPDLPEAVEAALIRMLAKQPADRFGSARAFAVRLRETPLPESKTQQRQALLAPLYEQLQAASEEQDWASVLALGGKIQVLAPYYRDVPQLIAQAHEQLRRPQPRLIPIWVWTLGALVVVGGAIALLAVGGGLTALLPFSQPTSTAIPQPPAAALASTVTPQSPTATPTSTATPQPPTATPTPTATPQPPTATPGPSHTPTPPGEPRLEILVPGSSHKGENLDVSWSYQGAEQPETWNITLSTLVDDMNDSCRPPVGTSAIKAFSGPIGVNQTEYHFNYFAGPWHLYTPGWTSDKSTPAPPPRWPAQFRACVVGYSEDGTPTILAFRDFTWYP